jgi:hypothetical protein
VYVRTRARAHARTRARRLVCEHGANCEHGAGGSRDACADDDTKSRTTDVGGIFEGKDVA